MGKKKHKRQGHFCWVCDRMRPNEKFSGKGHSRNICRKCSKLGNDELVYRQAARDLGRCMTWNGFIRRKQREIFERFLEHEDPRVRAMATEMQLEDSRNCAVERALRSHLDVDCHPARVV